MSMLFVALAVGAGFLLGLRLGLALGHRNERRRQIAQRSDSR